MRVFKIWLYQRILGISWIDKISNIEAMRIMQKKKEIVNTVKKYWYGEPYMTSMF